MTTKNLQDPIHINYDSAIAPQLLKYVEHLNRAEYILVRINQFKILQKYENQVDFNYIVIEKGVDGFNIYDNVHFREKHDVSFQTSEDACEYVELLLQQPTLLDYSQIRSAKERGLELGGDTWLRKNEGDEWKKVRILHYRDAVHFPEDDVYYSYLHYLPYKKDGKLSKVASRMIYAGTELRLSLDK